MWLFEGDDQVLQGKRLWLRPGKIYLFGRTVSEPGQTAISDKTISRKHLTITVDCVPDGDALRPATRSKLTITDLNTKVGTTVNGIQIRMKHVATEPEIEIKMGHCAKLFRIKWFPVVLTFSFTSKELRADPISTLRADLEQLDIKILTEYDIRNTTHAVAKKRNTAKGLQALINGKYIVTEDFIAEVVAAAAPTEDGASLLEQDFEDHWPDAIECLPLPAEEPIERPALMFAPDPVRENIFEGYTFIFYDQKQFDALLAAITNGKGKAVAYPISPNESQIDDFIRHVKSIAGEKGLGEFEDGSEGKGVVVVRYIPKQGNDVGWYQEFTTNIALRLDHRPVDQRDFLDAIVMKDASVLRRPLEVEQSSPQAPAVPQPAARRRRGIRTQPSMAMDVDEPVAKPEPAPQMESAPQPTTLPVPAVPAVPAPPPRRGRAGRAGASRFKGFDDDDGDMAITDTPPDSIPESQGLFVSQNPDPEPEEPAPIPVVPVARATRSRRKRAASSSPPPPTQHSSTQNNLMDDIAPTAAAAVKRRRIERGASTTPPKAPEPKPAEIVKEVKVKKELDILDVARQNLEQVEARAEKEKQELAQVLEGVDLAEIRKLAIVEDMPVRESRRGARGGDVDNEATAEEDNGRWNSRWNGRRNFKAFRTQGADNTRRPRPRTIVALEEAKPKGFGIGDDYWLEEEDDPVPPVPPISANAMKKSTSTVAPSLPQKQTRGRKGEQPTIVDSDSDDNEDDDEPMLEDSLDGEEEDGHEEVMVSEPLHKTRVAKKAQRVQSQRAEASQRTQQSSSNTTSTTSTATISQRTSQRTQSSRSATAAVSNSMTTTAARSRQTRAAAGVGMKRSAPSTESMASSKKRQKRVEPVADSEDGEDDSGDELGFKLRR